MRVKIFIALALALLAGWWVTRGQSIIGRPLPPLNSADPCVTCDQYTNAFNAVSAGGTAMIYTNGPLTGIADSKTVTCSFWVQRNSGTSGIIFEINSNTSLRFRVSIDNNSSFQIDGFNSTPTQILQGKTTNNIVATTNWYHVLWVVDMSNTNNRACYVNGVSTSVTWSFYVDDTLDLSPATPIRAMFNNYAAQNTAHEGGISEFWIDDSFIDQPCYFYCSGRPADLSATGQTAGGQDPAIYLSKVGSGQSWRVDSSGNGNHFSSQVGTLSSGTSP